jgi:hypothetical protein
LNRLEGQTHRGCGSPGFPDLAVVFRRRFLAAVVTPQ